MQPALAQSDDDWTRLLEIYVTESADGVNRVDYEALADNEADRAALDAYIAGFETRDLSTAGDAEFAAWANLYNAVTVRHILERYPLDSIRDGYVFGGPWKKVSVSVGGNDVSLDAIEHDILRPRFKDPRVHYAINCASYGCPNLPIRAWSADTLDQDLDAAARAYVNHPRGVSVSSRGLTVSSIYKWFQADFGGSKGGVINHLLEYAEPALAEKIRTNPKIRGYEYDWSLNDTRTDPAQ
ncbi:DUF547 domain-containing protein [Hyphomonas atlantica]|uniref:DUF547 domain-containing protein n=2 Tax=Hyphomonadaceae TaxID=69657 RepID=UPI003516FC01